MGDKWTAPRMWGLVALLALLLSAGAPGAVGHDGHEVETAPYDASVPGPLAHASVYNPAPLYDGRNLELGGHTLTLDPAHTHVEVHMMDITGRDVPGRLALYNDHGSLIAIKDFCFETGLELPSEAAELTVMASPLVHPCPIDGLNNGPATQGEILLVFH